MPNYNASKIYKIVDNTNGNIYIGSTTQSLAKRLGEHRDSLKCYQNGKGHHRSSFKILENKNYEIVLLENVCCESKEELHSIERKYIEENVCVNKQYPLRTKREYYLAHKEDIIEKTTKYYEEHKEYLEQKQKENYLKNKESILERMKEKIHCECGCIVRRAGIADHKKTAKHQELMK